MRKLDEIDDRLFTELREAEHPSLNIDSLAARCGVKRRNIDDFERRIYQLVDAGKLVKKGSRRVSIAQEGDYVEGRYKPRKNGDGIVIPDDGSVGEIYIPRGGNNGAFLNDKVRVRVKPARPTRGHRSMNFEVRGKISSVLERAFVEVVGQFTYDDGEEICVPDDPRFPNKIIIDGKKAKLSPSKGDKVVVHIEYYGDKGDAPRGRLVTVLGPADAKGVDIAGIMAQYALPKRFSSHVIHEAKNLPEVLRKEDYAGRKDCRKHIVITIDPDDARDFDDAICVKHEKDGSYRVWVHIADVSYFVKPGSKLDKEAEKRGNSTYLVDRVIPMLPEVLSNGLCSLQPKVDRLTKCVEILIDPSGMVLEYSAYPAVIHSKKRYTYEEAMGIIDGGGKSATDKIIELGWEIAAKCRERRLINGSLDLDFPDRKIRLNKDGEVGRIDIMYNDASHQLIEEFMLLANECVAKELKKRKTKTIYRVHEEPAKERIRELEEILAKNRLPSKGLSKPENLVKAIKRIKKHPAASALSVSVLRSMKRARYSKKPLGHYGLAKKDYTHFTSPIRRYADLIVHRCLFEKTNQSDEGFARIADHISWTERNSADAEIDSKMVKLQKYLERIKNDPDRGKFQAVVIDVRPKGLWIDLPTLGLSGVVPIRAMGTESFKFNTRESSIESRHSGKKYRMGDKIMVHVLKIDKARRLFDFTLAGTKGRSPERTRKNQPSSKEQVQNKTSLRGRKKSNKGTGGLTFKTPKGWSSKYNKNSGKPKNRKGSSSR